MKTPTLLAACLVAFLGAAVLAPAAAHADCQYFDAATRTFDGGVQPATIVYVSPGAALELEDTTKIRVDTFAAASSFTKTTSSDGGTRPKLMDFTANPDAYPLRLRHESNAIAIQAADGGAYDTTIRGCSP